MLPTAQESFREGWKDVLDGNTHPIERLWDLQALNGNKIY
jgi:hypothetical protein